MDKLSVEFQSKFNKHLIYDETVFQDIDSKVKLHDETKGNPLSSAASCLNVFGSLRNNEAELIRFLNHFGLNVEKVFEFPTNSIIGKRKYSDKSYVVFEWVGPNESPINEKGGGRGLHRTSIDAYIIAKINGKITQLLIEWKFTEGKSRPIALEKFSGFRGLERLNRYVKVLVQLRGKPEFPFIFSAEKGLGISDFSADHLFQLLRMTLLAKMTTPIQIGNLNIEDYRVVHLSHSMNEEIEILHDKYIEFSPGLKKYEGKKLYDVWRTILSSYEKGKFIGGNWDLALSDIHDEELRNYLLERYR